MWVYAIRETDIKPAASIKWLFVMKMCVARRQVVASSMAVEKINILKTIIYVMR
jgi:hypothetical protein